MGEDITSDATYMRNLLVVHLPVCSPQNLLECYLPKSKEFRENKALRNSCVCPMVCKLQSYGVSLSMASYPSQIFLKKYNSILQPKDRLTEKFYRANYVELHLYYDNAQMVNIDQFPKYTFERIMSSLGGQMGIFLGASLISLVEFVDFIVGAIMAKLKTARNKVGKQKTVDTIPTKN